MKAEGSRLRGFFARHWWVGLVASVCSIVSVPLAVVLYQWAKREPRLVYAVNATRTVIVKAGVASDLKVTHRDKAVTTDFSVAQVAIWNQGDAPIRRVGVLKRLRIATEPRTPILEATTRAVSREEIEFRPDGSNLDGGVVPVDFRVLEHGDGGSVQLIYAGPPSVAVRVEGVVEGQRRPSDVGANRNWRRRVWLAWPLALVSLVTGFFAARLQRGGRRYGQPVLLVVFGAFVTLFVLYTARMQAGLAPPFGF